MSQNTWAEGILIDTPYITDSSPFPRHLLHPSPPSISLISQHSSLPAPRQFPMSKSRELAH